MEIITSIRPVLFMGDNMSQHNLSETTIALMKYAKQNDSVFEWLEIRRNVLGKLYHENMKMGDVLEVVATAWLNARKEPRLQMPHDNDTSFKKLLISPVNCNILVPRLTDAFTAEQFYQSKIDYMMYELMFTKIDWIDDWRNEQ